MAPRSRPIRPVTLLALLVAATLALAGCTTRAHKAGAGEGLHKGDRYVALGDSYTAAYLTGKLDTESGGCLRSLTNYPRQVADKLGLELTDVSCGGATTADVTAGQKPTWGAAVPPQIDAVGPDTRLVTIGLGGNDFNLFGRIIINCMFAAQQDPTGSPCTDIAAKNPRVWQVFDRIQQRLVRVVELVRKRAPEARVLLVGYPQAFPATGGCAQFPIATGDMTLARDLLNGLNGAVEGAASDSGASYVDVWTPSAGHDICSKDPWIAGARPERTDGFAYHPYPEEQQLVARQVLDVLAGSSDASAKTREATPNSP
ncbi:SGNH/GDSL hydrolase family protein [Nocardioides ginsengisoli]|uniref:SGNH/GDSL hydrolase family protein n=1 Tax=Nocardioides ginsengisoli TaxID=363868 RepID=A0ABW3W5R1_9ACTN